MRRILVISYLLVIGLFVGMSSAYSQQSIEDIMTTFFGLFETDSDAALDYVFSTNPLIDTHQEGLVSLKERLRSSRKLLGNYCGYEIVNVYAAGESYMKYVYAIKYDRQPLMMTLVFYKPADKWKLQVMNIQKDADREFILKQ